MRGVARFSVDYFMSHSTKTFVGEPFSVSLISVIEKFYAYGVYHDFVENFLSHSTEKFRRGTPLCF